MRSENAKGRRAGNDVSARDRILRTTAVLFAERGFSAVGMTEIGDAVGLGRGALYYHISSKEELLYDIITTHMGELLDGARAIIAAEVGPEVRLRAISRHLMRIIADRQSELTVCFREVHALTGERRRKARGLHVAYQALWSEVLSDGVAKGAFRPVSRVVIKGLLGMYFYSFLWLRPQRSHTPEMIGEAFADVVLNTVRAEAGKPASARARKRSRS